MELGPRSDTGVLAGSLDWYSISPSLLVLPTPQSQALNVIKARLTELFLICSCFDAPWYGDSTEAHHLGLVCSTFGKRRDKILEQIQKSNLSPSCFSSSIYIHGQLHRKSRSNSLVTVIACSRFLMGCVSSCLTEFGPLLDFDMAGVLLSLFLTPPLGSPWLPVLRCV